MSDRKAISLTAICCLMMGLTIGMLLGNKRGHAEMKRWSDEWYASHPVVKEWWQDLPSGDFVCNGPTNCVRIDITQPVPTPKPKASKPVPLHIEGWYASHPSPPAEQPKPSTVSAPDWLIKLEPCESRLYRFHDNMMTCEPIQESKP
jgi:hypothetical protein